MILTLGRSALGSCHLRFNQDEVLLMKTLARSGFMVAAVVAAGMFAEPAQAQCNNGYGYGDGYSLGFFQSRINSSSDLPPYFSRFPPVYYSRTIIPRPYGWSPFAIRANDYDRLPTVAPEPLTVTNPYVTNPTAHGESPGALDKSASIPRPKIILNPFFVPDSPVQVVNVSP